MPYYARAFGLLTVGRLLWQAVDESNREAIRKGKDGIDSAQQKLLSARLDKADGMRLKFCEAADQSILQAERLSGNYPVPVISDERTFYGPPIAIARYQIARAMRNIPGTVQLLDEARRAYPRDDWLHREQVMARMWNHEGLARGLLDSALGSELDDLF